MLRALGLGIMFLGSSVVFSASSCGKAVPTSDASFCSSFKSVAMCRCDESMKKPKGYCATYISMQQLYQMMITTFGNLDKACTVQKDTGKVDCIDSWLCYVKGYNAQGLPCNNTGNSCP